MWGLNSVIWLIAVATAESPEVPLESAEHSLEAKDQVLLEGIMLELKTSNASAIEKEAVLKELSVLVDTRRTEEERVLAVRALNEIKEDKTLPFYWEILGETDAISWEILDGLTGFSNQAEVGNLIQKGLYTRERNAQSQTIFKLGKNTSIGLNSVKEANLDQDLVLKAIIVAGELNQPEIANLLVDFTKDMNVPYKLRETAFLTLESNYAAFLDEKGRYELEKESDMLANQLYAASVGATTSVLLGSVGVWGQSEVSEGLGYGGGAIMGITGGYLYADQLYRPSVGQATLMASSVSWGIIDGSVLASSLDLNPELSALSRTVGVVAGAGYGYWQRDKEIDPRDVLELDFLGYWGAQMGVGIRDIAGISEAEIQEPLYEDYYTAYNDDYDEERWVAEDAAWSVAYDEYEQEVDLIRNKRQQAMLIGSAIGLAAGHPLVDKMNIRSESIAFSGVYSAEFAAASALAVDAFGVSDEDAVGVVRTGIHSAMAGALVYDHFNPVTYEQSLFSAYGSGIGHLLGSGAPFLLKADDRGVSHGMLWTGLAGTVAGTYLGNDLNFNRSDWVMNGVGAGLSLWHFSALSSIVDDYGLTEGDQDLGVLNTGLGLSGLGLVYAGTKSDIQVEDSLFLGMTTAWGAYYGGLLPMALNLDLEDHEHLLMTLVASDIGLIAGSYGVFKAGYEPKRSVLPQLLGVTGATLGALGSSLFTTEAQTITANTLGWGTIGIAGGIIWEKTKKNNELSLLPDMNLKMAQKLRFQMTPQVDQEGNVGVFLGLHN